MNASDNQKKEVIAEENNKLEKWLLSNSCCGQEMVLEETCEEDNNQVCLKYICPKCKKTIFDLQKKSKKVVTLSLEQRKKLFFYLGSIQQILYEVENK